MKETEGKKGLTVKEGQAEGDEVGRESKRVHGRQR